MYERRLKLFLAVAAMLAAVVIFRLVQLQIVRGGDYREQAAELLTYVELAPTARGRIFDRRNRLLARDEPCFDFCLDYRMLSDVGSAKTDTPYDRRAHGNWVRRQVRRIAEAQNVTRAQARMLFDRRRKQKWERTWQLASELTGLTRQELAQAAARAVRRVAAVRRSVGEPIRAEDEPQPITSVADEATAVNIRARLGEMIGASVRPSHRRWYPRGSDACHVIGRLGRVTVDDRPVTEAWQKHAIRETPGRSEDVLTRYVHGDLIGRSGIEKACEDLLRGRRGYRLMQRAGRQVADRPAERGRDVHLTLDIELQRKLAALLDRPGAIVVIDVPTGEVLAMVSNPAYDLNDFTRLYPALASDQVRLPLYDRTVAVRMPPGSTIKPITALAGLAEGKIAPNGTLTCTGWLISPTYQGLRCWLYKQSGGSHGPLDVVTGMTVSCNVFFCKLGQRLGLSRMRGWMRRFGLMDKPGTGLPGERAGLVVNRRGQRDIDVARQLAIGQGPIAVTPMHVANAMAAIARNGQFRTPLLVRELADERTRQRLGLAPLKRVDLGASAEAIALVQEGMYKVVNSSRGTARKHARHPQIKICGKTGTAQTSDRRIRIDTNNDGRLDAWGPVVCEGDTAWFAGFAPYRQPRIAFAVMVEYSDRGGGPTCGPIAREVVSICDSFGYLGE